MTNWQEPTNTSKLDLLTERMRVHFEALSAIKDESARNSIESLGLKHPDPKGSRDAIRNFDRAALVRGLMLGVEKRFGITPNDSVERKLNTILDTMEIDKLNSWGMLLLEQPATSDEWCALVESLTVHETYFNRDQDVMNMLRDEILPELIERRKHERQFRLRLWSAACSTGEEAHYMTMLTLQAFRNLGLASETDNGRIVLNPAWSIEILGTDLSSHVVRIAQSAVYADFEQGPFREMDRARMRFFEEFSPKLIENPVPGVPYYKVRNFITQHSRFRQHNLLLPLNDRLFDLVLCRNVLIYFDQTGKQQVQQHIDDALACGGALLMGGTDLLLVQGEKYDHRFGKGGDYFVKI